MGNATSDAPEQGEQGTELRTIAFRMREIHRLLAIRAEQENRRLEAEGLEPVTESRFLVAENPQTSE